MPQLPSGSPVGLSHSGFFFIYHPQTILYHRTIPLERQEMVVLDVELTSLGSGSLSSQVVFLVRYGHVFSLCRCKTRLEMQLGPRNIKALPFCWFC